MITTACAALLLIAADADPPRAGGTPPERDSREQVRMRFREEIIIRVPMRAGQPKTRIEWKERKGPRCLSLDSIAAAAVSGDNSVDMMLRGGKRVRVQLESACPALDYYSGFYLRSSEGDRMICADRDSLHSRSGGECEIERIRLLEPREKP